MFQPVANASSARIAALCDTATDRLASGVELHCDRRAIAMRGDSPPGGWKSSPAASAAAKAVAAGRAQLLHREAFPDAEAHLAQA